MTMAPKKYQYQDDGMNVDLGLIEARALQIIIRNLRREKTGMHGLVGITLGGAILAHDTFNLGRHEDRRRLASGAHTAMDGIGQATWTKEKLQHEIDIACLHACEDWEIERFKVVQVSTADEVREASSLLPPHIEADTGNIVFGPPGGGKSWLLMLAAAALLQGTSPIWVGGKTAPVLYVDLERSGFHFGRRVHQLGRALGCELTIAYINARGMGLTLLRRKLRQWSGSHPGGVILYDSISRVGMGSLKEDDVANGIIDMANYASDTWIALAHTPRADKSHTFGSQHFDAGADMMISLASEERGNDLGCVLRVTKANHMRKPGPLYYRLRFAADGTLANVGKSQASEWFDLAEDGKRPSSADEIASYLGDAGEASASQIADAIKRDRSTVAGILNHDPRFWRTGGDGKGIEGRWQLRVM